MLTLVEDMMNAGSEIDSFNEDGSKDTHFRLAPVRVDPVSAPPPLLSSLVRPHVIVCAQNHWNARAFCPHDLDVLLTPRVLPAFSGEIVHEAWESSCLQKRYAEKVPTLRLHVNVAADIPRVAFIDAGRARQILSNIIGAAETHQENFRLVWHSAC